MTTPVHEPPFLGVVLPTLNESAHLTTTLDSLQHQTEPARRVLIVDGGSTDGTMDLARGFTNNILLVKGQGRGGQIAAGVSWLSEEILVVAHADMIFPPEALARIRAYLRAHPECPGGCLGHRFRSSRWIYRAMEWCDRRRARAGESYGDQAQFFRREDLARVGGFPEQPIMEDVELSRRLRQLGRPVYLDHPVSVSPRRFEQHGVVRTVLANWRYRQAYRRHGLSACQAIYQAYYRSAPRPSTNPRADPDSTE